MPTLHVIYDPESRIKLQSGDKMNPGIQIASLMVDEMPGPGLALDEAVAKVMVLLSDCCVDHALPSEPAESA